MKTSELIGDALDWVVATKCEGFAYAATPQGPRYAIRGEYGGWELYMPSRQWFQGGPIIGQMITEGFELKGATFCGTYQCIRVKGDEVIAGYGPTPLIAAMRCYVIWKLGVEVTVPEEFANDPHS